MGWEMLGFNRNVERNLMGGVLVNLTLGELTLRTDDSPDDRSGAKDLSRWADEPVRLVRVAHPLDVREHPCLYTELYGSSNDGSSHLRPEHRPRRDLHIMSKLEIARELQRLGHCDITPRLEHHHGNRLSGERVTNDKFRNDVETDLLIGDGLDHADGNNVEEGDDESEDERPYWHVRGPNFYNNDAEDKHAHCERKRKHAKIR